MKKEFALDPGGPKRLTITYSWTVSNAEVDLDGRRVMSFASRADLRRGHTGKLADGSALSVRFGSLEGAPFLKGFHVIRNGAPLPGSAADPVPGWAWIFMIACAFIPVITLGGALPAVLGVSGMSAIATLARRQPWSVGIRVGASAAVTLSCWLSLGLFSMALRKPASSQPQGWHVPFSTAITMSSSPDQLISQIDNEYIKRGYNEQAINGINENLRQNFGALEQSQNVACLRAALRHVQSGEKD
jgi:hypothetical protein